uniref:Uncharacterized protein n=1 Tax=Poecilia formosa TaxID=48698 RepID=A0A087YSI0_POEFO
VARNSNLKTNILTLPALNVCKQPFEHGPQSEVCWFRTRNNSEAGLAAVVSIPVTGYNTVLSIILLFQIVDYKLVQAFVSSEGVFPVIMSRDKLLSRFMPDNTRLRMNSDGYSKAHILTKIGCAVDQRKSKFWWLLQHSSSVNSSLC